MYTVLPGSSLQSDVISSSKKLAPRVLCAIEQLSGPRDALLNIGTPRKRAFDKEMVRSLEGLSKEQSRFIIS